MKNEKPEPNDLLTRLDKKVSKTDPARVDMLFMIILVVAGFGVVLLVKVITGK